MEEAITLGAKKAIKMLSDSGQIGRVEKKTIYNDPNDEGVDILGDGNKYVYASPEVIDLQNVIATVEFNGHIYPDYDNSVLELSYEGGDTPCLTQTGGGGNTVIVAVVIPTEEAGEGILAVGTYIKAYEGSNGIYSLTEETIHPIDPKYLPESSVAKEVTLTGVNTVILGLVQSGGGTQSIGSSVDEVNAFFSQFVHQGPIILKFPTGMGYDMRIYNPMVGLDESGNAAQVTFSVPLYFGGASLTMSAILVNMVSSVKVVVEAAPFTTLGS